MGKICNKRKSVLAWILMLAMILIMIPTERTQAAKKISENDFFFISARLFTYNYIWCLYGAPDIGSHPNPEVAKTSMCYVKEWGHDIITNRGITFGDSLSKVQKAYGKTQKRKINNTDSMYIRLYDNNPAHNLDKWKYYLEYRYVTKYKDKICIRFYFDKNDKVCAIIYQPVELDRLYSKTFFKSGVKIIPPEGKQVTMKKIDGKKVYMIPIESSIIFEKENSNTQDIKAKRFSDDLLDIRTSVYDKDDEVVAFADYDDFKYFNIKYNVRYSVKGLFGQMRKNNTKTKKLLSYKKFGDYKFIAMKAQPNYGVYDRFFESEECMIPDYLFFQLVD